MKRFLSLLTAFCLIFACGCGEKENFTVKTTFYFDAPITVILPKDEKFDERFERIEEILTDLNEKLDAENKNSEVYAFNRLNSGESLTLSDTVNAVLTFALYCHELTNGAYNPLVYPLAELWGFSYANYGTPNFIPPSAEKIAEAKTLTDINNITLDNGVLTKNADGVMLDLGGIAKGYAADIIYDYLKSSGVKYGYVDFGSSSSCFFKYSNKKPNWNLSIRNPEDISEFYLSTGISDVSVATSGDYERFYEYDGKHYCHVIDPESGVPITNGMHSATVITESAALADALATALLVMGESKAKEFVTTTLGGMEADFTVFFVSGHGYYANTRNYKLLDKSLIKIN